MINKITLPQWLDFLLFNKLGAKYCRMNSDMTVIDWDRTDIKNYLGTYFPRSYCESYCLFTSYIGSGHVSWEQDHISIFDFGCGTGGEIIGLITAIEELCPKIKEVTIKAFDGNLHALKIYETIISECSAKSRLKINSIISAVRIDDLYDLEILKSVITDKYDVIISFKAVCEFVTKQQFEKKNAYQYLSSFLMSRLNENGIILLVDVTTYNKISEAWLPDMMDAGLKASKCNVICKNNGYNFPFIVSHSRMTNDVSKIVWRLVK